MASSLWPLSSICLIGMMSLLICRTSCQNTSTTYAFNSMDPTYSPSPDAATMMSHSQTVVSQMQTTNAFADLSSTSLMNSVSLEPSMEIYSFSSSMQPEQISGVSTQMVSSLPPTVTIATTSMSTLQGNSRFPQPSSDPSTTAVVESQTVSPNMQSQTESPNMPSLTTSTIMPQTASPNMPPQTESTNLPLLTTSPNMPLQTEPPTMPSLTTSPNMPQTGSSNMQSQTASPNMQPQTTSPNVQPQTASPNVQPQTASPNVQPQTASPNMPSQTESPNVPSLTTSPNMQSQTLSSNMQPQTTSHSMQSEAVSQMESRQTLQPSTIPMEVSSHITAIASSGPEISPSSLREETMGTTIIEPSSSNQIPTPPLPTMSLVSSMPGLSQYASQQTVTSQMHQSLASSVPGMITTNVLPTSSVPIAESSSVLSSFTASIYSTGLQRTASYPTLDVASSSAHSQFAMTKNSLPSATTSSVIHMAASTRFSMTTSVLHTPAPTQISTSGLTPSSTTGSMRVSSTAVQNGTHVSSNQGQSKLQNEIDDLEDEVKILRIVIGVLAGLLAFIFVVLIIACCCMSCRKRADGGTGLGVDDLRRGDVNTRKNDDKTFFKREKSSAFLGKSMDRISNFFNRRNSKAMELENLGHASEGPSVMDGVDNDVERNGLTRFQKMGTFHRGGHQANGDNPERKTSFTDVELH